ncbi:hypothetical protein F4V43_06430 [Paenibacillus spiritus]|uniref:DUF5050 domain-containing protein n=1 Tax=Paenibacillus spiritus TaxID=2496557 RepID=A0A5J5GEJ0_9BACL|nr:MULTISPECIES: hypothetical protein [Paenibacillus]KAA9006575.1 hypothetical protein F4V43_06430 [Paenibacillus spiritus]
MKKIVLLASLFGFMLLILSSCGEAKDYSDTYNPDTDYQYFLLEQGRAIQSGESDTGYYFLNNNYIYYMDKGAMKPVLLDNRPESDCLKQTATAPISNCNAYVSNLDGLFGGFLAYNDHHLYVLESAQVLDKDRAVTRYSLIRLSLDGTKRTKVLEFKFRPMAIAIHRGIVYYSSQDFDVNSDGKYQIFQYDLNKRFAKPKQVYLGKLEKGSIGDIIPYGKNVYFLEAGIQNGANLYRTFRYDIQDETVTGMFTGDPKANCALVGILHDRLIFNKFYGDVKDPKSWVIYEADLQGNHEAPLPIERDFFTFYYAADKYIFGQPASIYMTPEQLKAAPDAYRMTVYDQQYQPIDTVDLSFLPKDHNLLPGDDRYMFAHYRKEDASYIAYLDKQELGSGKAKFKTLIKTDHPDTVITQMEK